MTRTAAVDVSTTPLIATCLELVIVHLLPWLSVRQPCSPVMICGAVETEDDRCPLLCGSFEYPRSSDIAFLWQVCCHDLEIVRRRREQIDHCQREHALAGDEALERLGASHAV